MPKIQEDDNKYFEDFNLQCPWEFVSKIRPLILLPQATKEYRIF